MIKNVIALVSLTALTGLAVSVAAVGCSSSDGDTSTDTDGGKEGGSNKPPVTKGDGGDDDDGGEDQAVGHSGLPCTGVADCQADGDDDICSKGAFGQSGGNDIYPTPICFDPNQCSQGTTGTVDDLLCDEGTGTCLGDESGPGPCYPTCIYGANGFEENASCQGNNKCAAAYIVQKVSDSSPLILGFCYGGCTADADCEGTAGQKCQTEFGFCLQESEYTAFPKNVGDACTAPASDTDPGQCNCGTVLDDKSPDADKGFCTSACVTGPAGDAFCASKKAGWACTTKLPAKDDEGGALFGAQPADVRGQCALPCTVDADCTGAGLTAGATAMTCQEFAGGKFCSFPVPAN